MIQMNLMSLNDSDESDKLSIIMNQEMYVCACKI